MIRIAVAALAAVAFTSVAEAGHCSRSSAAGVGVSKEIATAVSVSALNNVIAQNGEHGVGRVKTRCVSPDVVVTKCTSVQRSCR